MGALSTILWKLVAVAVFAFGLTMAGYMKGRSDGKIEQLKGSVEAYQERGDIDNETRNLGDYDLCLRVGGLPDQCDELRRLEQAATAE